MHPDSIVIIGAGAAGLAAARDLSRTGREVIVLEARERFGGRVFTHNDPRTSVPIELGAEFVHGKPPEIFQIAQAANLAVYEVSERHWYFEDGKVSKSGDFWKKIEGLMDEMKSSGADRSLREFLDSLPDDQETCRAKAMLTRYVEGFHAASIDRVSIHGLIEANKAADSIEGDRAFRFVNGYESLMNALRAEAESYGAKFYLNTAVRDVDWPGEEIEVTCETATGSRTFRAPSAVITLPLGVLQASVERRNHLRFVPELPAAKRKAIGTLAMGNVMRINLRFRDRFWEGVKLWDKDAEPVSFHDAGFFHFPDAPFPTWWTQLPMRAPLLVGWAGGPKADRIRSPSVTEGKFAGHDSSILDQAIASLATIFNLPAREIRDQLEQLYVHDWRDDPFSRGAYAYVPVNGLAAQRRLSEPLDRKLFFAGEATSVGHIGTVHGAIQSGQRAATEILNRD